VTLSICMAYYRNAGMLAHQMAVWAGYPDDLKAQIEVLVVDDSSPEPAVDVPRPAGLPALRIGRLSDVKDPTTPPWRQDAARNRAAHDAVGEWLFLTDMDHVLPAESLRALLALINSGTDAVYTFSRLDAPDLTPKRDARGNLHPHPNTYAMPKARYWSIGGYDEEYCGIYGTDGYWRKNLLSQTDITHLPNVPIIRFPREVIADASTRTNRDAFKTNPLVSRRIHEKQQTKQPPAVLVIPYRQQYPEVAA